MALLHRSHHLVAVPEFFDIRGKGNWSIRIRSKHATRLPNDKLLIKTNRPVCLLMIRER